MEFDVEKDLSINKFKLDEECLSHATTYYKYAEACSEAKSNMSALNDNVKLVISEANTRIREAMIDAGIKTTEAQIASKVDVDEEVVKAKKEYHEAEAVYNNLQVVVQAMEARRSELDNLVKLYCAGYFSNISGAKSTNEDNLQMEMRKNLNK